MLSKNCSLKWVRKKTGIIRENFTKNYEWFCIIWKLAITIKIFSWIWDNNVFMWNGNYHICSLYFCVKAIKNTQENLIFVKVIKLLMGCKKHITVYIVNNFFLDLHNLIFFNFQTVNFVYFCKTDFNIVNIILLFT
jgi:hypothetical protein